MVDILPFERSMTPRVIDLWNACLGTQYPLTDRLVQQNVLGDPFAQREGNLVATADDRIVGWVVSRCLTAVPPELARFQGRASIGTLCVHPQYRQRRIGSRLYAEAEAFARRHGAARLTVVHYPHHLLPGIPSEVPDLKAFLERRGFGGWREAYDLHLRLPEPAPTDLLERGMPTRPGGQAIRPAHHDEEDAIVDFVGREFPGGWHYDTKRFFTKRGDPSDILLVIDQDTIVGFSHTFTPESVELRGSTHWFPRLRSRWGGLGPIGIAAAHRHRGLGLALLCASVAHLRARAVHEMVVDWTDLVDFYSRLGFRVWKRYWQGSKVLGG